MLLVFYKQRTISIILAALLLVVSIYFGGKQILSANELPIVPITSVKTPGDILEIQRSQNKQRLIAKNFSTIASPGDPDLPAKTVEFIVPPKTTEDQISLSIVKSKTYELSGNFDIAPAPPAMVNIDNSTIKDWGQGKQISNDINKLVYTKNDLYPKQNLKLTGIYNMRQYRIAVVTFYPYQYNPVTKKVIHTTGGQINLNMKQITNLKPNASLSSGDSDNVFRQEVMNSVSNGSQINEWYPKINSQLSLGLETVNSTSTPRGGYMIVTTKAIVSSSQKLADFKANKEFLGYSPVTIATESDWGGGSGDTAANNIRNYLKGHYTGYSYVLFIGNPTPTNGNVPMKMLWPRRSAGSYQEAPSDYFYSDLTGNWDLNGNGYFGESSDFGPGGIDIYPEIIVGRIPYYGNSAELDAILQKTISYENGDLGVDWVKNVMYAAEPSDGSTPGYQLGEAIKADVATPIGDTTTRVYDQNYGLNPAPEYTPTDYSTVKNAWETTKPGFVFWWTHGNTNIAASIMTSTGAAGLSESAANHPVFTFQCSCLNGSPEATDNLGYALLKRGSIGTVSASRVSWYYPGETKYTNTDSNAGMTYQYAKNLVKNHMSAGQALATTKTTIPQSIWMNELVFNLYGDPSLKYADRIGPNIDTFPLPDTDNIISPYTINAKVQSYNPISSINLKWNTNGSQNFFSVPMTSTGNDYYEGNIPSQAYGTIIYYYIEATDTKGTATKPSTAPRTIYSFNIAPDTIAPTIESTPLTDTGFSQGPYIITAKVADERKLENVKLLYSVNGGIENSISMTNTAEDIFEAQISGQRRAGDTISYHIIARDASLNHNQAYYPTTGSVSFKILPHTNVAILNNSAFVSYFHGSNSNAYAAMSDILNSDPSERFSVTVVDHLDAAILKDEDVLILPDNAPNVSDLSAVDSWFTGKKKIITLESSTSYAAYSGLFWPKADQTYRIVWDSNSNSSDQVIKMADEITKGYNIEDVIDARGFEAQFFIDKLPPDTKILAASKTDPTKAYAVYRDIDGRGKFIMFGPYIYPSVDQYDLIRNAAVFLGEPTPPPPADITPPTIPANIQMTAISENSASISWDASTDNVAVAGYKIYRDDVTIMDTTSTYFSDIALQPDTTYQYYVTAYDNAGNFSSNSAILTVKTDPKPIDLIPPSIPQNLMAQNVTSNSIAINWSPSTDNVSVVGYKIFRNGSYITTVSKNEYQDSNLSAETNYNYTVSALDSSVNESDKSDILWVKTTPTPDTTPPSIPQNLSFVDKSTSTASMKWDASNDNVGVIGYKIFRNGAQIATTEATSYTDNSLSEDTIYVYNVAAYDQAGNISTTSNTLIITTDKELPADVELWVRVLDNPPRNYLMRAKVSLLENNQVKETAIWNFRQGAYIFPTKVVRNKSYTVKVESDNFIAQEISVDTGIGLIKRTAYYDLKIAQVNLTKISLTKNLWGQIKGLFIR